MLAITYLLHGGIKSNHKGLYLPSICRSQHFSKTASKEEMSKYYMNLSDSQVRKLQNLGITTPLKFLLSQVIKTICCIFLYNSLPTIIIRAHTLNKTDRAGTYTEQSFRKRSQ